MNPVFLSRAAAAALALACGLAAAQPAPASAPASGPRGGPHGMMRMHDQRPEGWAMMSRAERDEHRAKMRSFKTYDECKAYLDEHHQVMTARARERGRNAPQMPQRDACAGLKKP